MRLAVMQPYTFPYIGYFQLINAVDKFVFYDDVNFIKRGWINRNNILMNGEAKMFSIPLVKASQNKLINEVKVSDENWADKLLTSFTHAYKKAPHFEAVYSLIEDVFKESYSDVAKLAIASVEKTCCYIKLETELVPSSSIYNNQELKGQHRILDICKQVGADTYINPTGGRDIYSKALYKEEGVELFFIESEKTEYQQFGGDFVPWLSIIDILMFNSPEQLRQMLEAYRLV